MICPIRELHEQKGLTAGRIASLPCVSHEQRARDEVHWGITTNFMLGF
jgi:hypothetical protein